MIDKFTDRARKVMNLARRAAVALNHTYIGPEHILLGMIDEASSYDDSVISAGLGPEVAKVKEELSKLCVPGPSSVEPVGVLPYTPRGKKTLERAVESTVLLRQNYLGVEHLLLGMLHEDGNAAVLAIRNAGLDPNKVRECVLAVIGVSMPGKPVRTVPESVSKTVPDSVSKTVQVLREAQEHIKAAEQLFSGGTVSYYLDRLEEYATALFEIYAPFRIGDRVKLKRAPKIPGPEHGRWSYRNALVLGATGVVDSIDFRKGTGFEVYIIFDTLSYACDWGEDKGKEIPIKEPKLFLFKTSDVELA